MKINIGIDIGKNGAIVILEEDGIISHKMPMIVDELDYHGLYEILKDYTMCKTCHVVFEKLGVIYGSSKTTAFSMGHQAGAVEMACITLGIPFTKVRAVDWQKEMFQGVDQITKIKEGKDIRDTKSMATIAAKRLFPVTNLNFSGRAIKAHDGLVDALLMSEYSRRKYNG